jgi:lipopolysaccharide/colanic/teichoic acid biosynthesis glycosyltransferase
VPSAIRRPPGRFADGTRGGFYRNFGKHFLDVLLVLVSSAVVVPLVAGLAAIVAMDGHGPFFRQKRVGRDGRVFTIWKLRTMVPDAEERLAEYLALNPEAQAEWEHAQKLRNDPRVTRVGRILRKTSLDELPQLVNVLTGDMSLVGPRPIMLNQGSLYPGTSYFALRPGITGPWQISERNDSSFPERAMYDNHYEASLSIGLDISILVRTVRVVASGTGH